MKYTASLKETNSTFTVGEEINESFNSFVKRFSIPFIRNSVVKGGTGVGQYIIPSSFKSLPTNSYNIKEEPYTYKSGDTEICLRYYDSNDNFIVSTNSKNSIRKKNENVEYVTIMSIDVDKNPDKTLFARFKDRLTSLNLNFLMYTSQGAGQIEEFEVTESDVFTGETKETKTIKALKHNFRVFIELDRPIEPDTWKLVYNKFIDDLEANIGFRLYDRSADNISRHQMAPIQVEGRKKCIIASNTNGLPLRTEIYNQEAIRTLQFNQEQTLLRQTKHLVIGGEGGGSIDKNRNILGQLLWDKVDMEMLCDNIGLRSVHNSNGKITMYCHYDHKTNNDHSLCITHNLNAPPSVHCAAQGCNFNGKGATTAFFNEFATYIPTEWIRKYASPKIPILMDFPKEEILSEEIINKIGNVSEIFDNKARSIAGVAKTGSGKSHNIARYAVQEAKLNKKVVIFCSTKAEIRQMFKHIKSISGDLSVVELHMDADSSARGDIIITHYHYLLRKGHTFDLYDIVKYCEEESPVIIYDEIDSYFDIAFTQLYISNRYSETDNKYFLNNTCPSRRTHKFACATCKLCTNPWFLDKMGTYQFSWQSGVDHHMWGHPSRKDISFIPSLNNIIEEKVLHSSTVQEMTFKKLGQKTITSWEDNEIVITNNQHYIDDIINSSLYVYKITTGNDRRDSIIKKYNELSASYDRNNVKDIGTDGYDARKSSYINMTLNADKSMYPYHSCGVDILSYLDSKGMKKIVTSAQKNIFLTATLSDNHFKALKDLTLDVVKYEVVGKGWQPVNNLLIMTISTPIDLVEHAPEIIKTADAVVTTTNGIEHQLTLAMTAESKNLETIRKNADRYKMAIYNSNMASVDTNINKYEWNVLATYKRSPIGRGINLGNYSTIWVDYSCAKSMHCYDYTMVQDLHHARMLEHDTGLSQQVGRIMRKAMDSTSTKFVDEGNKVMIIHNTILQTSSGDKSLVDYKMVIADRLSNNYASMCKEKVFVKDISRYYDEADATRIACKIQEHFIRTGEVIDVEPNVPSECFSLTYSKSSLNIKRLYTEEEFNEIKLNVRYLEKLEFYIKEYSSLSKGLRRRQCYWVRLKNQIPTKLIQQYTDFFEGE